MEIEGEPILCASVHLDHHENPLVRKFQAEGLLEALKEINIKNAGVILAGDFNDTENSPAIGL